MCCMRRQSRRLEACHHLMVGDGKEETEKEWALFRDATKKIVFKKEGVSAGIVSGAFPLKIRKMPTLPSISHSWGSSQNNFRKK